MMARPPRTSTGRCMSLGYFSSSVHHRFGVGDVVVGVESELGELRILADQVLNRVLKPLDDPLERVAVGALGHVEHHVEVDSIASVATATAFLEEFQCLL